MMISYVYSSLKEGSIYKIREIQNMYISENDTIMISIHTYVDRIYADMCVIHINDDSRRFVQYLDNAAQGEWLMIEGKNILDYEKHTVDISIDHTPQDNYTIRLSFTVQVIDSASNMFMRDRLFNITTWNPYMRSMYTVPLDYKYVYSNNMYRKIDNHMINNPSSDPYIMIRPRLQTLTYEHTSIEDNKYFISINAGERTLREVVYLHDHVLFLCDRYVHNNNTVQQLTLYRISNHDDLFESTNDNFVSGGFGTQVLSMNLHKWNNKGRVTQISKCSFIVYSYIEDADQTEMVYIDVKHPSKSETYAVASFNLSNCRSPNIDEMDISTGILVCTMWNATTHKSSTIVTMWLSFKPFFIPNRVVTNYEDVTMVKYILGNNDIEVLDVDVSFYDVTSIKVSVLTYSQSDNISLYIESTASYGRLFSDDLSYAHSGFDREGRYLMFCSLKDDFGLWIDERRIIGGTHKRENILYYTFNTSRTLYNTKYYCVRSSNMMIVVYTDKIEDGAYVQSMMMLDGNGKYSAARRIPMHINLVDVLHDESTMSSYVNGDDLKTGYIFTIGSVDSKVSSYPLIKIHKVRYDYPTIKVYVKNNTELSLVNAKLSDTCSIHIQTYRVLPVGVSFTHNTWYNWNDKRDVVDIFDLINIKGSIVNIKQFNVPSYSHKYNEGVLPRQSLKLVYERDMDNIKMGSILRIYNNSAYIIDLQERVLVVVDLGHDNGRRIRYTMDNERECLSVTTPTLDIVPFTDSSFIVIISNSGYKKKRENIVYCAFVPRIETTGDTWRLERIPILTKNKGEYTSRVYQHLNTTYQVYYNNGELKVGEIVWVTGKELTGKYRDYYSIDYDPLQHDIIDIHNVEVWRSGRDGHMYTLVCQGFNSTYILPFEYIDEFLYRPMFDLMISIPIEDRVVRSSCDRNDSSHMICILVTQNMQVYHVGISIDGPSLNIKRWMQYETVEHGVVYHVCVCSKFVVVGYMIDKVMHIALYRKWKPYMVQKVSLLYEGYEVFDCQSVHQGGLLRDRLVLLNHAKRLQVFDISNPTLSILSPTNDSIWKHFEDYHTNVSMKVVGIEHETEVVLGINILKEKTYGKMIVILGIVLLCIVVSLGISRVVYMSKTYNDDIYDAIDDTSIRISDQFSLSVILGNNH